MSVSRNHGYVEGVRRIRLQYRSWEVSRARATLIFIHGLSDHGGRYEGFGERMAEFGCSTFILDLRGHGHSEGRRGHVQRFDVYLQDIERFRREVQGSTPPGKPTFLIGHSMGALIVLRYLQQYDPPFRGAVLSAPWLGTMVQVPRWKVTAARALDRVLPALPMPASIPSEYLSHDRTVVERYRHDPLVHGRITPRLFVETAEAMRLAVEQSDRVRVPLLVLLAGQDHLVDTRRALTFARSLRQTDVTVRVYPDFYHELFLEIEREIVYQDMRAWLMRRLAAEMSESR